MTISTGRPVDVAPAGGPGGRAGGTAHEAEKRKLWLRHNALQPTRPVIFCDPENGWNEIIRPEHLACESELARDWEFPPAA